jgi:hypothetical protein
MHMTQCTAKMQSNNLFLLFKLALASAVFSTLNIVSGFQLSVTKSFKGAKG